MVVLPIAYAPPIWWMKSLLFDGEVLLEANESFNKQTIRSKCAIRTPQGLRWLAIPVNKNAQKDNICKAAISYAEDWQRVHWRSIATSYGNTPYFDYLAPELEPLYHKKVDTLWEFNHQILNLLLDWLQVCPALGYTEIFHGISQITELIKPKPTEQSIRQGLPNTFTSVEMLKHWSWISMFDLIFHEGPNAYDWLRKLHIESHQKSIEPL
jgi:hypothetical protein